MQLYYMNSTICIHAEKHSLPLFLQIDIHAHAAKHTHTYFYIHPVKYSPWQTEAAIARLLLQEDTNCLLKGI